MHCKTTTKTILSPKEAQRSTNRANNVTTTKNARPPSFILTQSSTRTLANSELDSIHHNPNRVLTNSVNDKFPESQPELNPENTQQKTRICLEQAETVR